MPHGRGGIADYAHDQANALQDLGCDVKCLCTPSFTEGRQARYTMLPELQEGFPDKQSSIRILRQMRLAYHIIGSARQMADLIEKGQYSFVLMHFSEYLAPLWAPRLRKLKEKGVIFGSVLHDPARDYVVGPKLWHDWSVQQAFSFLNVVYVHSEQELASGMEVRTVLVPYGIHTFPKAAKSRAKVREELRLPPDAKVLLAAGFIRDNKNLDLVIRALSEIPDIYLIIAGTEQAGGNRPVSHYQELAEELGCVDRCRWLIRYVDAVERADLFVAADICVMTYSASFRSASASLSAAVNYRLPSIVSSAPGSMESVIKQYGIGIWVEPDSVSAIADGLRRWLEAGIYPDWETYMRENSWGENARRVMESMMEAQRFNERLTA